MPLGAISWRDYPFGDLTRSGDVTADCECGIWTPLC